MVLPSTENLPKAPREASDETDAPSAIKSLLTDRIGGWKPKKGFRKATSHHRKLVTGE